MTWQTSIVCTEFGGHADPNTSAYDRHVISDTELGCALPYRFRGVRPQVIVQNVSNGRMVVVDIVDIGPWNTNDAYWQNGARPQAESGTDMMGRPTNKAGLDLTPAAAKFIGTYGKGVVNWTFVDDLNSSAPTS